MCLPGVGTGLDQPHPPAQHRYIGLDLTAAMLRRARPRTAGLRFTPLRDDVQRLPFRDASFDAAILHLILAVVPAQTLCLAESVRVLKPGGTLLVFDKFLHRSETGWKRILNPLTRPVATRLDVVFEDVLEAVGGTNVTANEALGAGWFHLIRLEKPVARGHDKPVPAT